MESRYYLGIDLDDSNAVISYYTTEKKEPETVSPIAGSELFQIPAVLTKKRGIGQWFIGEDAKKLAALQGNECCENLLTKAINREKVLVEEMCYEAEELLALFLKKLLLLPGRLGGGRRADKLAITLESLSERAVELFLNVTAQLGFSPEQLMLLDRRESFYYFAYSQKEELWLHDICLFDCRGEKVHCALVERNQRTVPQMITLTEKEGVLSTVDKDGSFLALLQEVFAGRVISGVYLTGDGFEGDWMKRSLAFMCRGRRAFIGKNLYSKGACHAAFAREHPDLWQFVYMGENELKLNVSLKVENHGHTELFSLLDAGTSWYEAQGECEVILAEEPEIDFWLQLPGSREAKVEKLNLVDLPERPKRASRVRITAKPVSDSAVRIQIKDLGFGEFFKSSDKVWEYVMSIEGGAGWEN